MLLLGVFMFVDPTLVYNYIENNFATIGLYIAAILFRLIIDVLLFKTATESNFPVTFRVLGFLGIIAAIAFILMGQQGFVNFMSQVIPEIKTYGRESALIVMALGGFIIYAFQRTNKKEKEFSDS